ncbi:sugar ABC transporter permease [Haliovirga abyssi]|uniref:Xylose transport system permease protein XylH n=1 Tax=Haliovirga abyssi TaxID=2996794 RepID=A0AAU9D1K1_9FUSO|nr:hypothetical protein [Haliovirga abyssi]BDU49871.1 xylose ABC transporter permease [Haliovirga abyssi]
MKKFLKSNATLIALLVMWVILAGISDVFFTPRNLSNLTLQVTTIGIIAVGMTMVILLGGIDLSVGSLVGLSAIIVTLLMHHGVNVWLAIIIDILIVGVLVGLWNGFWIAKYKMPPFIVTLAMMTVARGTAMVLSNGSSVPVTDSVFPLIGGAFISKSLSSILLLIGVVFAIYGIMNGVKQKKKYNIKVNNGEIIYNIVLTILGFGFAFMVFEGYKGIPFAVAIFIAVVFAGVFILRKTKFGRNIYATGGNEEAARLSGINIFGVNLSVYTLIAILSAISGIILASRLNGASPNLGTMFELDAIASVAIGGTSLSGGSGTITGTIIGTLIIGTLNNGMSLMGISSFYQLIVKGLIILLAVWFDVASKKKKA